jgi:hypothetical protein
MMADRQVYHATLGRSVKNAATDVCSKCARSIPDDHVPLMLWDDSDDLMWVYCEACEGPIMETALKAFG